MVLARFASRYASDGEGNWDNNLREIRKGVSLETLVNLWLEEKLVLEGAKD
jgi:hypothetical protein